MLDRLPPELLKQVVAALPSPTLSVGHSMPSHQLHRLLFVHRALTPFIVQHLLSSVLISDERFANRLARRLCQKPSLAQYIRDLRTDNDIWEVEGHSPTAEEYSRCSSTYTSLICILQLAREVRVCDIHAGALAALFCRRHLIRHTAPRHLADERDSRPAFMNLLASWPHLQRIRWHSEPSHGWDRGLGEEDLEAQLSELAFLLAALGDRPVGACPEIHYYAGGRAVWLEGEMPPTNITKLELCAVEIVGEDFEKLLAALPQLSNLSIVYCEHELAEGDLARVLRPIGHQLDSLVIETYGKSSFEGFEELMPCLTRIRSLALPYQLVTAPIIEAIPLTLERLFVTLPVLSTLSPVDETVNAISTKLPKLRTFGFEKFGQIKVPAAAGAVQMDTGYIAHKVRLEVRNF